MLKIILFTICLPTFAFGRSAYKYPKKTNDVDSGIYFDPYQPFGTRQHAKQDPFNRETGKNTDSKLIPFRYRVEDDYDYNSDSSSESKSYSQEEFSGFYGDDEDYYEAPKKTERGQNELKAIAENESRIQELESELDYKDTEIITMKKKLLKLEHKLTKIEKMLNYKQRLDKNSVLSGLKYYNK